MSKREGDSILISHADESAIDQEGVSTPVTIMSADGLTNTGRLSLDLKIINAGSQPVLEVVENNIVGLVDFDVESWLSPTGYAEIDLQDADGVIIDDALKNSVAHWEYVDMVNPLTYYNVVVGLNTQNLDTAGTLRLRFFDGAGAPVDPPLFQGVRLKVYKAG